MSKVNFVGLRTRLGQKKSQQQAKLSNQMKNDPRSYDRNFYNCVKKPEKKFRTSTGLEPVTSRYR